MLDKADIEDALLEAQARVGRYFQEAVLEYERPDMLLKLAMTANLMPEEAWNYVDDDTKMGINEVFNA